jgi:flagellin-like hook-associated protein FlgL
VRINNTVTSQPAKEPLFEEHRDFTNSLKKLSTGLRISHSFGNATGLIIADSFRSLIRQTAPAEQNIQGCITAIRITGNEANLVNAINNLTISSAKEQAVIPQSIVDLLSTE